MPSYSLVEMESSAAKVAELGVCDVGTMTVIAATKTGKVITYREDGVNATSDASILDRLGVSNMDVSYGGGLGECSADPKLRLVAAAE
jgi:hypothetical protein